MPQPSSPNIGGFIQKLGLPARSARVPSFDDASGLPVDADAPSRRRPATAIATSAATLAKHLSAHLGSMAAASPDSNAIFTAWRMIAGELANQFVPEKYVGGVLHLAGGSSAEVFEFRRKHLRTLEATAKKISAFAGLRQIRVRATR